MEPKWLPGTAAFHCWSILLYRSSLKLKWIVFVSNSWNCNLISSTQNFWIHSWGNKRGWHESNSTRSGKLLFWACVRFFWEKIYGRWSSIFKTFFGLFRDIKFFILTISSTLVCYTTCLELVVSNEMLLSINYDNFRTNMTFLGVNYFTQI